MPIPRLLLLTVLIAPCAAPALAQSAPAKNYFPAPPLLGAPTPAPDWHTQIPAFRPNAEALLQTQPLPTLQSNTLSRLRAQMQAQKPQLLARLAQNNNTCYAIRDYQFKQEDPASDATQLSGYTTCLPRTGIQKKDAAAVHMQGAVLIR